MLDDRFAMRFQPVDAPHWLKRSAGVRYSNFLRRTLQDWASVAEIAGAIAVVSSLIYLGYELRENTRAIQAHTRQAFSTQDLTFFETALDQAVVAAALAKQEAGEELSLIEQSQLKTRQHLNFRIFEHAHYQYRKGTLEEGEWDRYARIIKNKCTDESAQAMWSGSEKTFQPDFRHVVNEIFTGC